MAEPLRSDEYGARPNSDQVERARVTRQVQAGDRPANTTQAPRDSTRNTNVVRFGEYREGTNGGRATPARPVNNAYPDTARQFRDSYARAGIQPSNVATEPNKRTQQNQASIRAAQVEYGTEETSDRPNRIPTVKRKEKKTGAVQTAKRELARVRATGINLWAIGISSTLFLPLLMLSIFSVIFFGIASYVDWLYANAPAADPETGFLKTIINGTVKFFATILSYVAFKLDQAFGINISFLDPHTLFLVTYGATVGIGYIILLLMLILYSASFIKCFSGEHAHTKQIAFLVAVIGHTIPVMNLFPWFLVWAITVWLYPK